MYSPYYQRFESVQLRFHCVHHVQLYMTVRSACSREGLIVFIVTYWSRENWYMVRLGKEMRKKTWYFLHSNVVLLDGNCGM